MCGNSIRLEEIDHIGAPVWNADQAAAFFADVGIPIAFEEVLPEYSIRAVFLDLNGVYLEFLEPTGEGNVKTFLERHGPGYQHVAYRVSDIDATMDGLEADGITFQSETPVRGVGDSRIVFVQEQHTAGLQVELVERGTGSG